MVDLGNSPTRMLEERRKARLKYLPSRIKWLLIAEAPPSAWDRYFYFDHVAEKDVLFVELMKLLCQNDDLDVEHLRLCKPLLLRQFQREGFHLVDAVEEPMPEDLKGRTRRNIIKANRESLLERIAPLVNDETRVILIKSTVFELYPILKSRGFNVINDVPIEFPLYQHRRKFVEKMKALLKPYFNEREGRKSGYKDGTSQTNKKHDALKYIVVDGSNVANDGLSDGPSVKNIVLTYDQLLNRLGCEEVYVVIGPGQMHKIRDREEEIDRLNTFFSGERRKYLVEAPAGHYDDEFVIQLALDVDSSILSNDQFKDIKQERPGIADELDQRLLKYRIVNERLVVPGLGDFMKT